MKILIASTNPGKVGEISAMLKADVEWVGLGDFDRIEEVVEDGATFADNARKKASGYARATGCWTIADDSGLVVDELGGEPGVNSASFCSKDSIRCSNRRMSCCCRNSSWLSVAIVSSCMAERVSSLMIRSSMPAS